jgi:hypothetical protein
MVAVLMGVCANLQTKTSKGEAGSFAQTAAMWGLGSMMAVYIAGGVSGAHCKPFLSLLRLSVLLTIGRQPHGLDQSFRLQGLSGSQGSDIHLRSDCWSYLRRMDRLWYLPRCYHGECFGLPDEGSEC